MPEKCVDRGWMAFVVEHETNQRKPLWRKGAAHRCTIGGTRAIIDHQVLFNVLFSIQAILQETSEAWDETVQSLVCRDREGHEALFFCRESFHTTH